MFRNLIKGASGRAFLAFEEGFRLIAPHMDKSLDLSHSLSKIAQIQLANSYRRMRGTCVRLEDTEFRAYSQNGEDGILLYLSTLLDIRNGRSVEICAGSGIQCNSANLIINHGWYSLLVDGSIDSIKRGRAFYAQCRDTVGWPPLLVQSWVTAEGVNDLIKNNGFEGELDLLVIDVDGMDYWIWKAIDVVRPKIVVVEVAVQCGPERSITVPYDPNFRAVFNPARGRAKWPDYAGASLPAFVKLARSKGYRLVGTQRYAANAFFVRDDVAPDMLPEVSAASCLQHPRARFQIAERWPMVADKKWIEV